MENKYIIYGLVDPRDRQLRYIGKSSSGFKRPKQHGDPCRLKGRSHKENWIRQLHKERLEYEIVVIQKCNDNEDLDSLEPQWISYFKKMGCPLTNCQEGGPSCYEPKTLSHSQAISKALKGRTFGSETRAKMSKVRAGKKASAETKAKMSAVRKGKAPYNMTDSTRKKLSKINGGRPFVDELGNVYNTLGEAAKSLDMGITSVFKVLHGEYESIRGHTFKYLESSNG